MVLSRSLAGENFGCSFRVDSYQCIACSNSSCRPTQAQPGESQGLGERSHTLAQGTATKAGVERERIDHHGDVDVGQSKVVDDKVRRDLHCHAGDGDGVLPKSGVLEDVGQADEGHVLYARRENAHYWRRFNKSRRVTTSCRSPRLHPMGSVVEGLTQAVDGSLSLTFDPPVEGSHAG